MNDFKNILIPVDFSENSINALKYVINLVKNKEFKLYVLHSYRLIEGDLDQEITEGKQLKEMLETQYWTRLRELGESYLENTNLDYSLHLELGFTVDVISRFIQNNPIDLIVMGTKGRSGIKEIMGSTTSSVLENTICPMLIIPKDAVVPSNHNITIASNFDHLPEEPHLNLIKEIARLLQADIEILNINNRRKIALDDFQGKLLFDKKLEELHLSYNFESHEDIEEGINKFINNHPTDILIMFPRSLKYFEKLLRLSLTRKFVLHSHVPILTLTHQ